MITAFFRVIAAHIFGKIIIDSLPQDMSIQNIWKFISFKLPFYLLFCLGTARLIYGSKESQKQTLIALGVTLLIYVFCQYENQKSNSQLSAIKS